MSQDGLPDLLFVPGLLCDAGMWRHQVEALSDIVDCHIADVAGHDSVEAIAESILVQAPDRFALAALSMGGYVALEIMRQAPERVTRLALLDTQPHPDTIEQADRRRGFITTVEGGGFDEVVDDFPPLLFHQDRLSDAALVREFVTMAHRVGSETFLRQQKAIIGRPDSLSTLGDICCPVLIACGRQDLITPLENSELMAATVPGAFFVVIEDCGHMSSMEVPELVNGLLRNWLMG